MKTPTLTEARRALLELQEGGYSTESKWFADTLTLVASYLDAQVCLNVENIGIPNPLLNQAGINDVITLKVAGDIETNGIVFCASDPDALKPDRRFFALSIDGVKPDPVSIADIKAMITGGSGPNAAWGSPFANQPAMGASGPAETFMGLAVLSQPACPNCIEKGVKQPGCQHE